MRPVSGPLLHFVYELRGVGALDEGHLGALAKEAFGQGRADAGAASGDEDGAVREIGEGRKIGHFGASGSVGMRLEGSVALAVGDARVLADEEVEVGPLVGLKNVVGV